MVTAVLKVLFETTDDGNHINILISDIYTTIFKLQCVNFDDEADLPACEIGPFLDRITLVIKQHEIITDAAIRDL